MSVKARRLLLPAAAILTVAAGPPTPIVDDRAGILTERAERRLAVASLTLERRTGHQFVVVTTPSLRGEAIERYSLALFNRLGVGRKCCDDGVGLLVAPAERKVCIEVGRGLERSLTDGEAKTILDRHVLPRFRRGDLGGGVEAASRAIIAEIAA